VRLEKIPKKRFLNFLIFFPGSWNHCWHFSKKFFF